MRQLILLFFISICFSANAQTDDYLLLITDTIKYESGYINTKGDTIIPLGKYQFSQLDTFRTYTIVLNDGKGWVAIDRNEKILYSVFVYDNGPDYIKDGLFRIEENGLIGYADAITGDVIIKPQYKSASPFDFGQARVSTDCIIAFDGEHTICQGGHWYFITKRGERIFR